MAIASKVGRFLVERAVDYEEIRHPRTLSAAGSAEASHVPAYSIVKAVLLKNAPGYLLALLPATHRIVFTDLREILGPDVEMAGEPETEAVFSDCAPGAVPAIGMAYGLKVLLDDHILREPKVCFEAGDHRTLICVSGREFQTIMKDARHAWFAEIE